MNNRLSAQFLFTDDNHALKQGMIHMRYNPES